MDTVVRKVCGAVALAGVSLLAGCPGKRVRIEAHRSAIGEPLVFDVLTNDGTPYSNINVVEVIPCDRLRAPVAQYWKIRKDTVPVIAGRSTFEYGELPPGWSVVVRADSLVAGCFEVAVAGPKGESGGAQFEVGSDGSVRSVR